MKNLSLTARAFLMGLLLLVPLAAGAQKLTLTGHVSDELGDVIGASVTVRGSSVGTITDMNGTFVLKNIDPESTVVVSFIGYKDAVIPVKGRTEVKVSLEPDAQLLSEVEVVAVGYGDVRRRDLTGSISKPSMDDVLKTPVANVADALGGRVAGVQVTSSDGGLGEDFNFVIRGAGSLTQSTEPLFVIDGFPQESSGMSTINPNDIKSIDFLKDASATAIYGSRGANGVVIITTKSGGNNTAEVTYNGSVTVSTVRNKVDMMDGYEFVKLQEELMSDSDFSKYYLNNGEWSVERYKDMETYDWQDEIYRTAVSHNHHLNVSGGHKGFNYSASAGFSDKQGVIICSSLQKYQGRFNMSQKVKKFKFTANMNFSSNVQNGANPSQSETAASNALMYSVWAYRPVSPNGNDLLDSLYDEDVDSSNDYRFNPVKSARNEIRKAVTNTLAANLAAEWEIIKNLKLKVAVGYTGRDFRKEDFNGPNTKSGNSLPSNNASKGINAKLTHSENRSYLNENTLTYSLNKNRHNFNALLGVTFQKSTYKFNSTAAEHIPNESFGMAGLDKTNTHIIVSTLGENAMMSYLGRVNYNYDSRYYFNFTMRADGSSKFPKKNRWGYFPSASAAWSFAREKFVKDNADWLTNGKLRFSWGLTGNNRIGDFDYLARLETNAQFDRYPFEGNYYPGYIMGGIANPDLRWETTEQYDLGLDLGFLDGRINLTLDYYEKLTHDLLIDADINGSSGYTSSILNVGKLRNSGFEFGLQTVNIKRRGFKWTSDFNIAFNINKIVALNSGQDQMFRRVNWDPQFAKTNAYVSKVGQQAGMMYGFVYDGTYQYSDFDITIGTDGKAEYKLRDGVPYYVSKDKTRPGDPKYRDLAGNSDGTPDGKIDDADRTVIGNGQPLFMGGFGNTFTYRGWDLYVFLQFNYGNDIYNINRLEFENSANKKNKNQFATFKNRWTKDHPTSNIPRADAVGSREYSSFYVEDGSYLKLKNISLGYTFKKKQLGKSGINSLRLYLSAENIATATSYSGPDPEVSTRGSILTPGFDWSAYPRAFNASFGLSLTF